MSFSALLYGKCEKGKMPFCTRVLAGVAFCRSDVRQPPPVNRAAELGAALAGRAGGTARAAAAGSHAGSSCAGSGRQVRPCRSNLLELRLIRLVIFALGFLKVFTDLILRGSILSMKLIHLVRSCHVNGKVTMPMTELP